MLERIVLTPAKEITETKVEIEVMLLWSFQTAKVCLLIKKKTGHTKQSNLFICFTNLRNETIS